MASLDSYLENPMRDAAIARHAPVTEEAHLAWWRPIASATPRGTALLSPLHDALPTLRLAVAAGASAQPAYDALVRQARSFDEVASDRSIEIPLGGPFRQPEAIELAIAEHPAGALPILSIPDRDDFLRCYRALGARGEPIDVPHGVHALYVSGLPNPGRLRALRGAWLEGGNDPAAWPAEMARLAALDRTWFHDRIVLVEPGGYGEVRDGWQRHVASETAWLDASMAIRIEHELAHHATHRLFGSHRLHLHDELIADFMGFSKALGTFDAALFLEALGLPESHGARVRDGTRVRHYLGGLDEHDLPALRGLLADAAMNVERLAAALPPDTPRLAILRTLAADGLAEIAQRSWVDAALETLAAHAEPPA